ncbi:hypothetical protein [Salmonella enterica]|uniref:hypothetical protein n=1 Tax=Salmonella enterica TaxID=28901 RepID=UPI0011BD85AD|nr:hypothetical protein [Salmonella enterica]
MLMVVLGTANSCRTEWNDTIDGIENIKTEMQLAIKNEQEARHQQTIFTAQVAPISQYVPELGVIQAKITLAQNREREARQKQVELVDRYETTLIEFIRRWDQRKPCAYDHPHGGCILTLNIIVRMSNNNIFKNKENKRMWMDILEDKYRDSLRDPECAKHAPRD